MKKLLVSLVALLLVACSAPTAKPEIPATSGGAPAIPATPQWGQHVDVQAFAAGLALPGAVIVDVRTPEEFAAGHIKGAVNLDVNGTDFGQKVSELAKDGTYLIYCRSGNRSRTAIKTMSAAGIDKTLGLEGGISAWTGEVVKG